MRMILVACAGLALPWLGLTVPASASVAGGGSCSAGARTLAPPGSHVPAGQPGGAHRPGHGITYIALRQILGPARFAGALRALQRRYGGGHLSEAQLEAGFRQWLPVHSRACEQRLSQFFTQWFDTAYPAGGGANRPMITGPSLDGPGFYSAPGACAA